MSTVYLTFDDGPNMETREILAILEQAQVPATFFLWGEKILENKELVRDISLAGHGIGNHTWSHPSLPSLADQDILSEIQQVDLVLQELIGKVPTIFRPPYGDTDERVRLLTNKKEILWDLDSKDWSGIEASEILHHCQVPLEKDTIILLHCFPQTVLALPSIIDYFKQSHHVFSPL